MIPIVIRFDRRRGGTVSAPVAVASVEEIRFSGDAEVPADTDVALVSPRGVTLALGKTAFANKVTLHTDTQEGRDYMLDGASAPSDAFRTAVLFVGSSSDLIASVPVSLTLNRLALTVPPSDIIDRWPTFPEMDAILKEVEANRVRAEAAAKNAELYDNDAAAARNEARDAARRSEQSRFAAQSAATKAGTAEQNASGHAASALESVNAASGYAADAFDYGQTAKREAASAKRFSVESMTSANNAVTSAENASLSEEAASRYASDAALHASSAAAAERAVRPFVADAAEVRRMVDDIHVNQAGWDEVDKIFDGILRLPHNSYDAALAIENKILGE